MRLLIVEDEIDLQETIAEGLRMDGYAVDCCDNGKQAYELLCVETYDLLVLDINLPGMDGFEILDELRKVNTELKVLILSARSNISDKVKGLDKGANDYLVKPFDFAELEARIRSLLRQKYACGNNEIVHEALKLDLLKHEVYAKDCKLELTRKEYSILEYFMLNQNRIISQEELIEHVWDAQVNSFSGAIRVHMATLRKKLKDVLDRDPIVTRIKEGYIYYDKGEDDHAQ